jgi:DNA polymerase III alpha subunit (gram-positive type)
MASKKLSTVSTIHFAQAPFHDMVIFDLETTGLSSRTEDIIQIAALRIRDGNVQADDFFCSYVRPRQPVSAFITSYTGITNDDVRAAPLPAEVLPLFSSYCQGSLLVAHNGQRFDIPFITRTCERYGLSTRDSHHVDSMHLSWNIWGRKSGCSHGLDSVIDRLQLSREGVRRHDARGDVDLTARCVCSMVDRLSQRADLKLNINRCVLPV